MEDLHRLVTGLSGADANGAFHVGHKNLPVADFAGARGRLDGLHGVVRLAIGHHEFQLQLGKKVHRVLTAAVNLRVAFLPTEAFHFGHGHAHNPQLRQSRFHVLEFKGFDDGIDALHFVQVAEGDVNNSCEAVNRNRIFLKNKFSTFC